MEDTDYDEPLYMIPGMVPNPLNLPKGCAFADRCERRMDRCVAEVPDAVRGRGPQAALLPVRRRAAPRGGVRVTEPLISLRHLSKFFSVDTDLFGRTTSVLKAVDDLSLDIFPGETFGLVGESGCGKTTVGKMLVNLYKPTAGEIWYEGQDLAKLLAEGAARATTATSSSSSRTRTRRSIRA